MMDFSIYKGWAIPEGVVVKVSAGTAVLWQKKDIPLLPDAYQQVTYIETDGNQYINTGVVASDYPDGISYVFSGSVTGYLTKSYNNYLFGCLANNVRTGNPAVMPSATDTPLRVMAGGNGQLMKVSKFVDIGTDFTLELICGSNFVQKTDIIAKLNGTGMANSGYAFAPAAMPTANIYLLQCNGISATSTSKHYQGKLYSFTMDDMDGNPIRNFVPCYRKADHVIGVYDTVGGMFYTNAGSGNFLAGTAVLEG